MSFAPLNPMTQSPTGCYDHQPMHQVHAILQDVDQSQKRWAKSSIEMRTQVLIALGQCLKDHRHHLATLISTTMGKPIQQALKECDKSADCCFFYSKHLSSWLAPIRYNETHTGYHQPLGTLLAIMPWNYPLWQVIRALIPAIAAGNGLVLSHAPLVTEVALMLESLTQSILPKDLFRVLVVDHPTLHQVIAHPVIQGVTLTGSDRAGALVAQSAGKHLKKIVLELGGSDPYIVLDDADLDLSAQTIAHSRLNNTGQVCIAAKRILIQKKIYPTFLDKLIKACDAFQNGDPLEASTTLGPLARKDLLEQLHHQVQQSIQMGATLLRGGNLTPEQKSNHYPITFLTDITKEMPAYKEELFGPVFSLFTFESTEQAIILANDTKFGLGSAIFSKDLKKAEAIALEIQAGQCAINGAVSTMFDVPFGGTKHSGFGKELGKEGLYEFTHLKIIAQAQ